MSDRTAAHQKKRSRVIGKCMAFLEGADRRFAKNQFRESSVNLDDRLRDMFESLPVDPTGRVEETSIIARMREVNKLSTVGALRTMRNCLAHGSGTYDPHELDEVCEILQIIVRAHLLRNLGVDPEIQEQFLSRDR